MHAFTAMLAADHLADLLREAEDERRRQLARGGRPTSAARALAFGRRLIGTARRLRSQPAGADCAQLA